MGEIDQRTAEAVCETETELRNVERAERRREINRAWQLLRQTIPGTQLYVKREADLRSLIFRR